MKCLTGQTSSLDFGENVQLQLVVYLLNFVEYSLEIRHTFCPVFLHLVVIVVYSIWILALMSAFGRKKNGCSICSREWPTPSLARKNRPGGSGTADRTPTTCK
jgi:hypothetical protein